LNPTTPELLATGIFALAIVHTFATGFFERLADRHPAHAGVFHLLGEVEVVFGFWALVLVVALFAAVGVGPAIAYVDGRNFTEPLFVFAIMVVAGSRPILGAAGLLVSRLSRAMPMPTPVAAFFLSLSLLPLLGSFITEPAAMTVAALLLRDRVFHARASVRLRYATLGVLFVNVSIGGAMTPYAAPPVLMVAGTWGWDLGFMLQTFGWRVAVAVVLNAALLTAVVAPELRRLGEPDARADDARPVPPAAVAASLAFLAGIVVASHHPPLFLGLLLGFVGYAAAYPRHHDPLILREALLVALFLAGLVVLGGLQTWWLQPTLTAMSPTSVYYGATALTAITDNAALTYLGSQVEGLSDAFKVALVEGAITGGGLTVIANAPNPAGFSILRGGFPDEAISPGRLFLAALLPTLVAVAAFRLL
jgi:MFS family permease